jgi:hypothetical protein
MYIPDLGRCTNCTLPIRLSTILHHQKITDATVLVPDLAGLIG